jgi:dTDP-4-amino-4,6-dideoxygalactose transaminase
MPFGSPVDTKIFGDFSCVVIDAAASVGAVNHDFSCLKREDSVIFSLHATKVLGCGEGAIAVCGSEEFASRLRRYLNFGFDDSRICQTSGVNGKMSEISAAYAHASLDDFSNEHQEWKQRLDLISELTKTKSYQTFISRLGGIRPYWIIKLRDEAKRDLVRRTLGKASIESRLWWPSLMSETPGVKSTNLGGVANSLIIRNTTLGLPLWRDLPEETIEKIVDIVESIQPH